MKTKTLLTIGIASAVIQLTTACKGGSNEPQNPLLQASELPFGAPDFSKIQPSDYLPAIEKGIEMQRENINGIVNNEEAPTFENTIVALEESGVALERVTNIFFALVSADKTPEIAETEKQVTPMLTDLENDIFFNKDLFARIKTVYDNERESLQGEDQKLLDETYKKFVRRGALLDDDKMARMKEINLRISDLQQQWGDMLPEATNNAVVWVDSKEELAGLSEADIAQCAQDAESRGGKAPYAIVIVNTTQQPLLASLDNRELRKKVFEASIHRADQLEKSKSDDGKSFCTFPIVCEMARLRAEQAALMGYDTYAAYSLENTMAKTPENVYAFLHQLIAQYTPKAQAETKAIEAYKTKVSQPSTLNSQLSLVLPRISPDGRYLIFTTGCHGYFHIWHHDADLWMLDLKSGEARPLDEVNSPDTESYHTWSSSGRWIVFSSRRDDGLFTRPFFAHLDDNGRFGKPFELPSADPLYHREMLKSYNIPEFMHGPVTIDPHTFASMLKGEGEPVKYKGKE
jgi:hypothetical protein